MNPLLGTNESVYVSGLLRKNQSFYGSFFKLLNIKEVELVELPKTKDIWCRDYMPMKSRDGNYLLFNYDPSYLQGRYKHKLTPRKDIIKMLHEFEIDFEDIDDINLEGGNVVQYEDIIIMTDAIYRENGIDMRNKIKQGKLLNQLEKHFDSEIIIIPHQPDDPLSHSDGVVRFLNKNTVLVNNFSSVSDLQLKESKHYLDNFFGRLGKAGLNILQVPYAPVDEVGEDEMPVAFGIYINFLETSKYVFLPQFRKEFKEKDTEAFQVFTDIFKSVGKEVVLVDSRAIAHKGGVLNCITWN